MIVIGTEGSPFVRKVQLLLAEKGLAWELQEINVFDPPDWFLAISPARRIPILRVGNQTLADSSAICGYLEKLAPTPALYPAEPMAYGQALWFEEYADTVVAAAIGFGLLRTLMAPPRNGQPQDLDAARKALHQKLPPIFDYLESSLEGRQWLVGEAFSIADLSMGAQLMGMHITRVDIDAKRWPELTRYQRQLHQRESFKARLAAAEPLMPETVPDLG